MNPKPSHCTAQLTQGRDSTLLALRELAREDNNLPLEWLETLQPDRDIPLFQEVLAASTQLPDAQRSLLLRKVCDHLIPELDAGAARILQSFAAHSDILASLLPKLSTLHPDRLAIWLPSLMPSAEKIPARFFISLLHHHDQRIQCLALRLLCQTADTSHIPVLKQSLKSPHPDMKAECHAALWRLGETEFARWLNEALQTEDNGALTAGLIVLSRMPGTELLERFLPDTIEACAEKHLIPLLKSLFQETHLHQRLPECARAALLRRERSSSGLLKELLLQTAQRLSQEITQETLAWIQPLSMAPKTATPSDFKTDFACNRSEMELVVKVQELT